MSVAAQWIPTWDHPSGWIDGEACCATYDWLEAEYGPPPKPDLRPFVNALADLLVEDLLRHPRVE